MVLAHTAMQEIDLIEEGDGKLMTYEFKWNPNAPPNSPKLFQTIILKQLSP